DRTGFEFTRRISRRRKQQSTARRHEDAATCWPMGLFLPCTNSMKRGKSGMDLPGVVRASREIPGGHKVTLELIAEREHVPAILLLPDTHAARAPGAVL